MSPLDETIPTGPKKHGNFECGWTPHPWLNEYQGRTHDDRRMWYILFLVRHGNGFPMPSFLENKM